MTVDVSPPQSGLGRVFGRGISWSFAATLWTKAGSFAAQVVLGYLLSDGDWGVYAIAISLATLLMTLQNGGAYELVVQRGAASFASLRGPVLWMALSFNVSIAVTLAVAAPLAAAFYREPEVSFILWILSGTVVLSTPGLLLATKLRIDLRFGVLARLQMFSACMRYGGTVILALLGLGPLSFVLPLPLIAVTEFVILATITRESPWRDRAWPSRWRSLLREVRWLLLGTVATVLMTMGDYLVLGRLVSAEVVGVYYFAFQLTAHVSMLAASNAEAVLMPTLTRFVADPERQRRATLRALRSLILVAVPLNLGLVVTIEPLESLIWRGRWEDAVAPVEILSVMLPVRLSLLILSSSLKARGQFRAWALLSLIQGIGLVTVAGVAGSIYGDATRIALVIALYFLVVSPVALWLALKSLGVTARDLVAAIMPAWLIAFAIAGAYFAVGRTLLARLPTTAHVLFAGFGCIVLYGAACRVIIPSHIADTLSVLPMRVGALGRRLLRLSH